MTKAEDVDVGDRGADETFNRASSGMFSSGSVKRSDLAVGLESMPLQKKNSSSVTGSQRGDKRSAAKQEASDSDRDEAEDM